MRLEFNQIFWIHARLWVWGLVPTKFWQPPEPYSNQGSRLSLPTKYHYLLHNRRLLKEVLLISVPVDISMSTQYQIMGLPLVTNMATLPP